ncbi:hypothetical protein CEXT_236851 [Caerostris extrusa]|uniref:Uncharacterized protein n=1 Tax=Caerostris extrusa TaxID=172846 RepID=A0AAV4TCU6_CAEEX|nr:hypothetical protein CEXT_236851 [Caerostris extrusa]
MCVRSLDCEIHIINCDEISLVLLWKIHSKGTKIDFLRAYVVPFRDIEKLKNFHSVSISKVKRLSRHFNLLRRELSTRKCKSEKRCTRVGD